MIAGDYNRILLNYYKKSFRRGRSAAAYYIDRLFITVLASAAVWLAVRSRISNKTAALTLTAAVVCELLILSHFITDMRFDRHIKKVRFDIQREMLAVKELIGYGALCSEINEKGVYTVDSVESFTADDVLKAYTLGSKRIISAAPPTEKAKSLLDHLGIEAVPLEEYFGKKKEELYYTDDEEIDRQILSKEAKKKRSTFKEFINSLGVLSKQRAAKYVCCGAVLMLMSFLFRYQLYYRLLASLSMLAGTAVYGYDRLTGKRKEAAEHDGF